MGYPFKKIEKKWQKIWAKNNFKIWHAKDFKGKKIYILDMFPYPSGEGLHVGHIEGYTGTDILSRYYRMNGYNVLHPMGWDAFGLPAENYAIKMKKNPMNFVPKNIKRYKKQMIMMGLNYDWRREINTTDPNYYKWTQWMFLKMYEKGLVYEKAAPINFCPSCKTGLANEEVVQGRCERCGSLTEIRYLNQWHIRITAYADRLLEDLDELDWPENVKEMQRNWIGKSEGYEIDFKIIDQEYKITVFTTRLDTIFGVTFLVLAPEHPLCLKIAKEEYYFSVKNYIEDVLKKPERERKIEEEMSGVFTGSYAVHPFTGEKIPIWISDYVLYSYGTGAIMGVPAHDSRDHEFAKKFNLKIIPVIGPEKNKEPDSLPFENYGYLINSFDFNGLDSKTAILKIGEELENKNIGKKAIYYKLRDWVFSRQRYWGEPIPLVRCPKCGIVPLKEKDLPLKLPKVKSYEPTGTGQSPLKNIQKWVKTKCPKCKGPAERETHTMPQWAGSCWYYLRYIDPKNKKEFANYKKLKYWLPVDIYVGGVEHAVLHLLYARFWHKFLYDLGLVPTKEPFKKLVNQGLILGPDHEKMSKSRGNVINPDEVVEKYGADTLRMYEMFMGPFEEVKPWDTQGIIGVHRFLNRIWELTKKIKKEKIKKEKDQEILRELNRLIKKVSEDIENFKFNTAISAMMEFINFISNKKVSIETWKTFVKLLFPFAPHISQEIWSLLGNKSLLDYEKWPKYDPKYIEEKTRKIIIQIDGKKRDEIEILEDQIDIEKLKEIVLNRPRVKKFLENKKINKIILAQNKILNIVTES
ncbi:MAG: leucine--tRNA ligase [Minisyncoccia bacterium]|jgi:leucyl-tRNA synthetase